MQSMTVEYLSELVTKKPDGEVETPWLKGRGPRWELTENFIVRVTDGDTVIDICVPRGYIFNGSSIPSPLWWAFPPTYEPAWNGAAVHDFIYSHLWRDHDKAFADHLFKACMLESGARPWVAQGFYLAVHRFGKGGW